MHPLSTTTLARAPRARARPTAPVLSLLLLALLSVALLVRAPTASAHAVLEGTTPGQAATVKTAPGKVTLSFNEDVKVAFGGIRVYTPDGRRVDTGKASSRDHVVTAHVQSATEGTWAVSWRVVSADGHPIRGAYTFDVGHASKGGKALDNAKDASSSSRSKDWSFSLVRSLVLLGLALGAGGGIFAAFVAPGLRPRFAVAGLLLTMVALVVGLALDASIAGGFSVTSALRWAVVREEVQTTWGRAAVIRFVLAALCLLVLLAWRRTGAWLAAPPRSASGTDATTDTTTDTGADARAVDPSGNGIGVVNWLVALPFLALAASQALSGHAVATHPVWLRLPLDAVHALAAAAWIGGLVQLTLFVRGGLEPAAVRRFSRLAFASVVVLVVTGLYAAYAEIGLSWTALVTTAYGRLVIAKALLLLAVLPIANVNRTRNVPALAGTTSSSDEVAEGRRALARYGWGELAVLAAVLAITGVLVGEPPARTAVAAKSIGVTKTLAGGAQLQVEIDPARTGTNSSHLYLLTPQGNQDSRATDMTMELTNAKRGIGPLRIPLHKSGPGHWTTSSFTIPFDGRWTIDVTVTIGEFDQVRARFHGTVAAAKAG